jgi:hypothetical protein
MTLVTLRNPEVAEIHPTGIAAIIHPAENLSGQRLFYWKNILSDSDPGKKRSKMFPTCQKGRIFFQSLLFG